MIERTGKNNLIISYNKKKLAICRSGPEADCARIKEGFDEGEDTTLGACGMLGLRGWPPLTRVSLMCACAHMLRSAV